MLVKVTKLEAAERQINSAIELLFHGGDPIAIHTLASAAFRLVRDLGAHNDTNGYRALMSVIRPGKEGAAFKAFHHVANFLKHADVDPDGVREFDDEVNVFILAMTVSQYQYLQSYLSIEMRLLLTLAQVRHPDIVDLDNSMAKFIETLILPEFRTFDRTEQLRTFAQALDGLRQNRKLAS